MLHPDENDADKRYFQLLKLECLKLVGVYAEDDNDGIPTAIDGAKAIFRSITEDKWGSDDTTDHGR